MKRIKFLILLLPLLSGCYNYRELNELGLLLLALIIKIITFM